MPEPVRVLLVRFWRSAHRRIDRQCSTQTTVVTGIQAKQDLKHLMGCIGGYQGLKRLLGFPLRSQVIDHRPVHLPVQRNLQAVCAQGLDAIKVRQLHLTQGIDLFGTKIHVTQRRLVTLSQTAHGVHQHGSDQIRFLGTIHHAQSQTAAPFSAAR